MNEKELDKTYEMFVKWDHMVLSRDKFEALYHLSIVLEILTGGEFSITSDGDDIFNHARTGNLYDQSFFDMGLENDEVAIQALVRDES